MTNRKIYWLLLLVSLSLLACTSVSGFFGIQDPNDPAYDPKEWEDDSIGAAMETSAVIHNTTFTDTPEPNLPTATPTEVILENPLNLTPQELAASGLHNYEVSTFNSEGELIETGPGQREYIFTATGVEFHYPGVGLVDTHKKIEPNIYVTESGWSTVTFTDSGVTYVEQNGAKNIWTRID